MRIPAHPATDQFQAKHNSVPESAFLLSCTFSAVLALTTGGPVAPRSTVYLFLAGW